MKRLIIAICAVTVGIIACTAFLFTNAKPKEARPAGHVIYVYDNGSAQIEVENVNSITQLPKEAKINGQIYLPGTIILPGDGKEARCEYPRRDVLVEER